MAGQSQLLQVIENSNRVARKGRYPQHSHLIEYKPFQIAPYLIAPVLAGETLKNANLQARIITDPLATGAGNILPWWCEHWMFYVKARQLVKTQFESMILQGTPLGVVDAASVPTYHVGGGIDWAARALQFCVENGGFRNEGEAWNVSGSVLDGLPMAAAIKHGSNWADSLMADGAIPAANNLENPHDPDVLAQYEEAYNQMRAMRMIDMSFEDYLEQQGVSLKAQEKWDRPELIRYWSNWAYPANVVDTATGVPSGAATFSISERADKDRAFSEPGFIIGLTVCRPKLFMGNQKSAGSLMFDSALDFMPRIMEDQPHTSLNEFATGTGPLRGQTAGYWVDLRDLLKYGDQFLNYAGAAGYAPLLPNALGEKRWMTTGMVDALFKAPAANKVRQDGVTRLSILSHPMNVADHT